MNALRSRDQVDLPQITTHAFLNMKQKHKQTHQPVPHGMHGQNPIPSAVDRLFRGPTVHWPTPR